MTRKLLTEKYNFDDTLTTEIKDYMVEPLSNWVKEVLADGRFIITYATYDATVEPHFLYALQTRLRERFPGRLDKFMDFVFQDTPRTLAVLQICCWNCKDKNLANDLEMRLYSGGSGYTVIKTKDHYDLAMRVPEVVKISSQPALNSNDELLGAWKYCYGITPDYNKTVITCQNILETMLRDAYYPSNGKPQLGRLIGDIKNSGQTLKFKGSNLIDDPNVMLETIKNIPQYRGMHIAGTGENATKDVAEYVLHTTIYLWNLHEDSAAN